MKEIINDFKNLMSDKQERTEFIGSMICALLFLAGVYFSILIYH